MSNLLPKKSWHVLNKDNRERVWRDEQAALQEEEERRKRQRELDQEKRYEMLKTRLKKFKSEGDEEDIDVKHEVDIKQDIVTLLKEEYNSQQNNQEQKHINFFEELEKKQLGIFSSLTSEPPVDEKTSISSLSKAVTDATTTTTAKKEDPKGHYNPGDPTFVTYDVKPWWFQHSTKKEEEEIAKSGSSEQHEEKEERKITKLTAQSVSDAISNAPVVDEETKKKRKDERLKKREDPLTTINKHVETEKHKTKEKEKEKSQSKSKDSESSKKKKTVEELRAERIKREKDERNKVSSLLYGDRSYGNTSNLKNNGYSTQYATYTGGVVRDRVAPIITEYRRPTMRGHD